MLSSSDDGSVGSGVEEVESATPSEEEDDVSLNAIKTSYKKVLVVKHMFELIESYFVKLLLGRHLMWSAVVLANYLF